MDPVSGRQVHGVTPLNVDDLLMAGDDTVKQKIMAKTRKDFQLGSENTNDCVFVGQQKSSGNMTHSTEITPTFTKM